jgi:hypothetical protein
MRAPPVPAFAKPAPPAADVGLNYQKTFSLPNHYIKYQEPVFDGFEDFSFEQLNYEITQKDIKFLTVCERNGSITGLSHHDFEKVVDVFEKFCSLGETQSKDHLVSRFLERVSKEYLDRIPRQTLETIYLKVRLI